MDSNSHPILIPIIRSLIIGCVCGFTWLADAATLWNGPLIVYRQPTADPTQVSNQDRLTPDVWLTRAASKGLFNAFYETTATTLSPTNTEWAFGTLDNYSTLHYTNWLAWLNGASPTTLVGQQTVLHLISDDIYLSLQFTNWVAGGSGGFAYQRSTPSPALLSGTTISNRIFSFTYSVSAGYTYVVHSSSNLTDWVSVATNVAAGSSLTFSNTPDAAGRAFYRVSRVGGP